MDNDQLIEQLRSRGFRKLTGPPEHWLTTFNTKFWGLERKHKNSWKGLNPDDLCVFHSTNSSYQKSGVKLNTGIIGIGVVNKVAEKSTLEWIQEIESQKNQWPFLIHFSQIWWFGDINQIVNQSIQEKLESGNAIIFSDIQKLTEKTISFKEMKRKDCCIAAQGSIGWVYRDKPEKVNALVDLLSIQLPDETPPLIENDPQLAEEVARPDQYPEGATKTISVNYYERNPEARRECIRHYGLSCQVCKFSFLDRYGRIGESFIHVHHLKALSEIGDSYQVDPINDLRPVCPNCHAMLHKKKPAFTIEELTNIIEEN
jgi:predicted HNH restriction endonuclease